jgi:hypothetical protein
VRTFDAYLKWALPIMFISGLVLTYVKERRVRRVEAALRRPALARAPLSMARSR